MNSKELSMTTCTISELGKRFGLSRSTLLYYHRIGLLEATERSPAGYRLYGEEAIKKLERICLLRASGLPLKDIGEMVKEQTKDRSAAILEERLQQLEEEMANLKRQQQITIAMLQQITGKAPESVVDKAMWTRMLETAGMDDKAMWAWHAEFETRAPHAHHAFLLSIGIDQKEALEIREKSKALD